MRIEVECLIIVEEEEGKSSVGGPGTSPESLGVGKPESEVDG